MFVAVRVVISIDTNALTIAYKEVLASGSESGLKFLSGIWDNVARLDRIPQSYVNALTSYVMRVNPDNRRMFPAFRSGNKLTVTGRYRVGLRSRPGPKAPPINYVDPGSEVRLISIDPDSTSYDIRNTKIRLIEDPDFGYVNCKGIYIDRSQRTDTDHTAGPCTPRGDRSWAFVSVRFVSI